MLRGSTKSILKTTFLVLLQIIILIFCILNRENISSVLRPIIIGLTIAFFVNPFMTVLEKSLKGKRGLSVFITLGFVLGIVVVIFVLLIPEIISTVNTLPNLLETEITGKIFTSLRDNITEIITTLSSGVTEFLLGTANAVKDLVLGFILSAYILTDKERLSSGARKLLFTFVKNKEKAKRIIEEVKESNLFFTSFFVSKTVDSLIIGIICFIYMMLFGMPYATLVSIIVAVTNIIPFFGPFIGGVPSAFLIMTSDIYTGIHFIIFLVILQTVDGYYLCPKILGNSTGLTPFWVLIAIIIFGGLFGFIGMIFGVPILAVMFNLIRRYVERRKQE